MTQQHIPPANSPILSGPEAGDHFHFLNHAASVKVRGDGARSMSVVSFNAPQGFGPPMHVHRSEDELFVVLDGTIVLFDGSDEFEAEAGSIAYLPRERPHTFIVTTTTAQVLNVTASRTHAPRFDEMVAALGTATDLPTIPEPAPIDPGRVADVCAEHGIDIVGPPPATA